MIFSALSSYEYTSSSEAEETQTNILKAKLVSCVCVCVDFKRQQKKKHPRKAASLTIQCERYMFECKRDKGKKAMT